MNGRVAEAGRNLSSGEIGQIHLTRAVLSSAPVVLLDEPEETLDPTGRQRVAKFIQETPATVLFVTQDMSLARQADDVWLVRDGEILTACLSSAAFSQPGPVRDFINPQTARMNYASKMI